MTTTLKAFWVHGLTASGAVVAMLALIAATRGEWPAMFVWLLVAFVVDGIDGPLARRFRVRIHAACIDGVVLDLIIDYLTFGFIPAYALFASGLLPEPAAWAALIAITFASALYFADTRMNTADNAFEGFPGCWQMVVLVIFAVQPPAAPTLAAIAALSLAMFLPVRFVHPVRTLRWRRITLTAAVVWTAAAALAAFQDFGPPALVLWALALSSGWLLLAGTAQQVLSPRG